VSTWRFPFGGMSVEALCAVLDPGDPCIDGAPEAEYEAGRRAAADPVA
jgi:hypothetical protein